MPDYALEAALDERRRPAASPQPRVNLGSIAQRALTGQSNWRAGSGELLPGGKIRQPTGEVFTGEQPVGEVIVGPSGGGRVTGSVGVTGVPGTGGSFLRGATPFAATPTQSSDDLVNQAIDAKRSSIAEQRSKVTEQLGTTRDKGRVAVLGAQLRDLETQDRAALQERHYNTMASAHQATLDHKQERDIESANQHIGLLRGLEQISAKYPTGTKEHADAVLSLRTSLAQQYPLGKLPKEGEDLLKAHSAIHDDLATQVQRAKDAGFTVTGFKSTKEGDIDVQTKASSEIAAQELKPYGLSPEQIQKPVGVRVGNLTYDASGKATFKGAADGAMVRIDTGTKKGGQVDMPVETYLKHGGVLSPEDTAAQAKAGRSAPTTPAVADATPAVAATEPARDTRSSHEVVKDAIAAGRIVVEDKQQSEKVLVRDKEGKQFRLPRSQLQDATKQGYQLVQ